MKEEYVKPDNKTPLIHSHFNYHRREEMRLELKHLFNRLGVDNQIGISDFVLAEMVDNFIMTVYNSKQAMEELGYNNVVDE